MKNTKISSFLIEILESYISSRILNPFLPKFRELSDISISTFSLKQTKILVELKFYNPNRVSINYKGLSVDVYLNDKKITQFTNEQTVKISKQEDFSVPIHIDLNLKELLTVASEMLEDSTLKYSIQGNVKIGKGIYKNIPIEAEGEKEFTFLNKKKASPSQESETDSDSNQIDNS